jgi:hypothetical protein
MVGFRRESMDILEEAIVTGNALRNTMVVMRIAWS